jgi:hypothetical protein
MRMPGGLRESTTLERMRGYLLRLLDRATERIEGRVESRLTERLEATLDVLTDEKLMSDLERADSQADEDARPYNEIRRDLGLA